jgi:hypothetical protein
MHLAGLRILFSKIELLKRKGFSLGREREC